MRHVNAMKESQRRYDGIQRKDFEPATNILLLVVLRHTTIHYDDQLLSMFQELYKISFHGISLSFPCLEVNNSDGLFGTIFGPCDGILGYCGTMLVHFDKRFNYRIVSYRIVAYRNCNSHIHISRSWPAPAYATHEQGKPVFCNYT